MDTQYLSDEQGRHTAVQIPIDEWKKIIQESKVFKEYEEKKSVLKKPSDFRGAISKSTAEQLLKYVEQTRWR